MLHGCYFIATWLLHGCYTVVSICFLDFAGYEQVVGGNPESKSASRPVCRDSDVWDPVVEIGVTGLRLLQAGASH